MRADRLLMILLLLQSQGRLTVRQLSERLEVSERTVHRDMEALGMSGVPVIAHRGAGGGWELSEKYRTDLTGLKPDEVKAIFVAGPSRVLSDLGLNGAADAALVKLMASLPDQQRRDAEFIRQRIHIDSTNWQTGDEKVPVLPTLQDALWQDRRIRMVYQRNDSSPVERLADPLGLVAKGSLWYLIAAVGDEIRTYRVSRIGAVHQMPERCVRPPGFDLAGYWARSSSEFVAGLPRYPAVLRAAPSIIPRLRFAGRFSRIETIDAPGADGWSKVTVRFETLEEASEYAFGFGPDLEVLEPEELRKRVVCRARETVEFYAAVDSVCPGSTGIVGRVAIPRLCPSQTVVSLTNIDLE